MVQPTKIGFRVDWERDYKQAILDFIGAKPDRWDGVEIDYAHGYSYGGDSGPWWPSMTVRWFEGGEPRRMEIDADPGEGELNIFDLVASFSPPLELEHWTEPIRGSSGS